MHDLDLKETTFRDAEAATIGRLVEGLRRARHDDDALLASGIELFEALYQSLASGETTSASTSKGAKRRARPV